MKIQTVALKILGRGLTLVEVFVGPGSECTLSQSGSSSMGYIKGAVAVVVGAMIINKIPGLFLTEFKVPPVVGQVAPGWEHVRDVYR